MKPTFFLLILLPFYAFSQTKPNESFTNPVWNGADPWLVKQGSDYFYCYTQNNAIYVSKSAKMTALGETHAI